ncbi:NAD dependent epimerase/dehydratase family protein [Mycobacterium xenopi 3993]|nr:NAD dependent epimerase/dehydratase family protein [Mycobacterium xenopi 3993]
MLLTGAAGFIGARVHAALQAAGHDVLAVDALLPAAHGPGAAAPPGCRHVDIRDAEALAPLLAGVDLVCHQAAVVGAGVDAADAPAYGSHNDFATAVLLAQMFAAGCGVWCWRRRWWSMGRAATTARSTGRWTRRRGAIRISTRGVRASLPAVRAWREVAAVDEDAPLRPAVCMRPARPRRSITRLPGRSRRAAR